MVEQIKSLKEEIHQFKINSKESLDSFRLNFLSKSGKINSLFETFKSLPKEEKIKIGSELNLLKQFAKNKFDSNKETNDVIVNEVDVDLTRPVQQLLGARHPISIINQKVISFFERYGFNISEGNEIVGDWENFGALNFAPDHPARDMQDTFFIEEDTLLRTHTSSVQVEQMLKGNLPIRTISPGKVFRNEVVSARAHMQFNQLEGLYIDKNVSFADLKQILYLFAQDFFGQNVKVRFRPSYFPFTEPSAEIDISCHICDQSGCNVCKNTGWVEILGCGMIDPQALKNCGIDPEIYSGFAFGLGIERLTMLKYGIKDIRYFSQNDVRFLSQFKSEI